MPDKLFPRIFSLFKKLHKTHFLACHHYHQIIYLLYACHMLGFIYYLQQTLYTILSKHLFFNTLLTYNFISVGISSSNEDYTFFQALQKVFKSYHNSKFHHPVTQTGDQPLQIYLSGFGYCRCSLSLSPYSKPLLLSKSYKSLKSIRIQPSRTQGHLHTTLRHQSRTLVETKSLSKEYVI